MTSPSQPSTSGRVQSALGALARVSWRLLIVVAALVLAGYLLGKVWVVVLPLILALFVTTLLWPLARFLRQHKWAPALAAGAVVLAFLALIIGIGAVIVIPVAGQAEEVTDGISGGLESVEDWLAGPPLNLGDDQIGSVLDQGLARLQESGGDIVSAVLGGIGAVGDGLVTLGLVLVLVFFYLKDGPRLLPWLETQTGQRAGPHVTELGKRYYHGLAGFTRTQALVGLIDAVFIGVGLLLVGVPLVLPLAVLVFVGAFVPIIGAFVAGGVAVLVALVSEGFTAALIVLAIIIVVQQLEGNVIEPILQSRTLHLHAAIIILAVVAGGSLAGVIGALFAVPVAALIAITWRYVREQLGQVNAPAKPDPADPTTSDPEPSPDSPAAQPVSSAAAARTRSKGKSTT